MKPIHSLHRIKRLHNYLKQYFKRWEKEYAWMQYDDGNIWECDIEGENFKLKSRGNVEEPANFETFLNKLTVFTEKNILDQVYVRLKSVVNVKQKLILIEVNAKILSMKQDHFSMDPNSTTQFRLD